MKVETLTMSSPALDHFLSRVRKYRMTARERREQEISFVIGNESLEGRLLHRGTVTRAITISSEEIATVASALVGESSTIIFEVDGLVRQFRLIMSFVEQHLRDGPLFISPDLILRLHAALGNPEGRHFGIYRTSNVELRGSAHTPPPHAEIPGAMHELCDRLASRWQADDALTLGAYALWRLNWVHPFIDGNGRTARALCYLVVSLKLGCLIPGTPTMIDQLRERRAEYYDGLATADFSFRAEGEPDLRPLQQLLEGMLLRQLQGLPSWSTINEAQLKELMARRIAPLSTELRVKLYGSAEIDYRAWSTADYLLVHVGSAYDRAQAEQIFNLGGQEFPKLLARPGQSALLCLTRKERGVIVRFNEFELTEQAAIWLEPNAAAVVEHPKVLWRSDSADPIAWALAGSLYILRLGSEITDLWAFEVLDLLIARHIQDAH